MTIWTPDLTAYQGPRYLAIADALAADLAGGKIAAGTKLPTHRDLAYQLGLTVGTISRAYAEAKQRGLTSGEVGRGTYILGDSKKTDRFLALSIPEDRPELYDFSLNLRPQDQIEQAMTTMLSELSRGGLGPLLDYQPEAGMRHHRVAGAKFLALNGIDAEPEQVVVTNGAQNGMAVTFTAVTRPGDTVLSESLTYPGIKEIAANMNLRLVGVAMDKFGLRPDALEEACAAHRPKALYCMPTLQNPTARMMPEARRREIAAIAQAHGVIIVEDDAYGLLPKERPIPLAAIAPDITVYITTLSKSIAPGIRVGYVYAQKEIAARIGAVVRGDCRMATPLMAEIVTRWIEDGSAERMADWLRGEISTRQAITRQELAGIDYETHPESYHLWVPLPEPWRADEFVTQLRTRGVVLIPAEAFVVGRGQSPHAVRICIGSIQGHKRLKEGLAIIAETLKHPSRPPQTVI